MADRSSHAAGGGWIVNVELPGVEIVAILKILLIAVSLLSVGLLFALEMIERTGHSRLAARIILEPAPTPERVVAASGGPQGQPRMSMLTRAPPVSPQPARHGYRDHSTVE